MPAQAQVTFGGVVWPRRPRIILFCFALSEKQPMAGLTCLWKLYWKPVRGAQWTSPPGSGDCLHLVLVGNHVLSISLVAALRDLMERVRFR